MHVFSIPTILSLALFMLQTDAHYAKGSHSVESGFCCPCQAMDIMACPVHGDFHQEDAVGQRSIPGLRGVMTASYSRLSAPGPENTHPFPLSRCSVSGDALHLGQGVLAKRSLWPHSKVIILSHMMTHKKRAWL